MCYKAERAAKLGGDLLTVVLSTDTSSALRIHHDGRSE